MKRIISKTDENIQRKWKEYIDLDRDETIRIDRPLNSKSGYMIHITTYSSDKVREFYFENEKKRDEVFEKLVSIWKGNDGEILEF